MSDYELLLWQAAAPILRGTSKVSGWRDRVEETFAELYLLGERPSVHELGVVLDELGAEESWAKELVEIWRRRVRVPARQPRALRRTCPWVRPFYVSERVVGEQRLRPIPERLADALAATAADYMERAEAEPAAPTTRTAEEVVALTVRAVRLWARTRDAIDDAYWPSVLAPRRTLLAGMAERSTHAGRARSHASLEEARRRRDEDEARLRELGLLDDNE